ncbi:MAG TPA: hypothetical protein DCO79_06485, partial [Spirochaeta sp.]|nr:hypothetical protein [Spirochaeta sp.]
MNKTILIYLIIVIVLVGAISLSFFTAEANDVPGAFGIIMIGSWVPTLAAVITLLLTRQKAELGRLIRSIRIDTGFKRALPYILGYTALLTILLIGAGVIFGLKTPYTAAQILLNIPILLFTGAIGEELGWRGLLLTQLLKKYKLVAASLVSGAIWALFHLPLWFAPELGYSQLSFPVFGISVLAATFLYAVIFIISGGNLLTVIIFHFTQNFGLAFPINMNISAADFFMVYAGVNVI